MGGWEGGRYGGSGREGGRYGGSGREGDMGVYTSHDLIWRSLRRNIAFF